MNTRKSLFILFFFMLNSCGVKLPNTQSAQLSDFQNGIIFNSANGFLRVSLKRNQEFSEKEYYSIMRIQLNLPMMLPIGTDPDPSRYFGVRVDNVTSPTKLINHKGFLLIFGRMNEAAFFLKPQKPDVKYSLAIVNYMWLDGELRIEPKSYEKIMKITDTINIKNIIYNFTNEQLGCAYYCEGESPILIKNILNDSLNYSFNILFFDEKSNPSSSRSKEVWKISVGFFKNGTWDLLKNNVFNEVLVDFDQKETKVEAEYNAPESGEDDQFSLFN